MSLHFNLINTFLFCIGLMFCEAVFGHTLLIAIILCLSFLCYLRFKKQDISFDCAFIAAFLMNLWYVLFSWGNVHQYDYFNFYMHAVYFIENDFFVSAPKRYLQYVYFQPPLWGAVTGIITKTMVLLGKTQEQGFDFVRFISLFAISGAGIIFWRFLLQFDFSQFLRKMLWVLFLFAPIHGILANLVNNDAMVYFLMLSIIYLAYLWNNTERLKLAFYIAGLLFLAGMTKFSGLMVVPSLAILGLFKLLKNKGKMPLALWGQFGLMALGASLGFLWGFFLLYYHFSLVPPPLKVGYQSLEHYSIMERLFSMKTATVPFVDIFQGKFEINVWLTLIKTSLFGEWEWSSLFWGYSLYGAGILLVIVFIFSLSGIIKYPLGKDFDFNGFIIVLFFAVIGAWINFWIDFPYFCSSEYRYVVILWPASLLIIGNFLAKKGLPKMVDYLLAGLIAFMILGRFMLYLNTI